jgi:hypothetical protein
MINDRITPNEMYNLYGSVIEMNTTCEYEENTINVDKVINYKLGDKTVNRLEKMPGHWNIDPKCKYRTPVIVTMNKGSFFLPHRDFISKTSSSIIRLNCFITNTQPEECTYIVDGKIQSFELGRWYIVNTYRTHYSFSFKDNAIHYIVDLDVSDEYTFDWVFRNITHHDRYNETGNNDREGYK